MGVLAFMSSFNASTGVSNFAHLGGMLFGYLYLRYRLHRLDRNLFSLFASYQQWRRRRLQQKFKVYMRKREHNEDRDRWVN
jgi:membrane associated rhomboid family serine protease